MTSSEDTLKPSLFGFMGPAVGYCMRLKGSHRSSRGERLKLLFSSLCKIYYSNLACLHPVLNYLDHILISSCHTSLKPT